MLSEQCLAEIQRLQPQFEREQECHLHKMQAWERVVQENHRNRRWPRKRLSYDGIKREANWFRQALEMARWTISPDCSNDTALAFLIVYHRYSVESAKVWLRFLRNRPIGLSREYAAIMLNRFITVAEVCMTAIRAVSVGEAASDRLQIAAELFTRFVQRDIVLLRKATALTLSGIDAEIETLCGYAYQDISLSRNRRLRVALNTEQTDLLAELHGAVCSVLTSITAKNVLEFPSTVADQIEKVAKRDGSTSENIEVTYLDDNSELEIANFADAILAAENARAILREAALATSRNL